MKCEKLPAYNRHVSCPKCEESVFIGTRYDRERDALRRTCGNCGHFWYEAPVSAATSRDISLQKE